jgi:hypothetical protein
MKNRHILQVSLLFLLISACRSKPREEAAKQDVEFYPVTNFIRAEIMKLDTIPLAVLRKTIVNDKTDSAYISKEEFKQATRVFLEPDITDPKLKKLYTETVFMDATINAITLTYSPGANEAEIRKLDVLLDPENNRLQRIYMEKVNNIGDSIITRKLLWNAGHSFQVITLTRVGNQPETVRKEKYVWDDRE